MKCSRCVKQAHPYIMSMFNRDVLCMDCLDKEKKHPKYLQAVQIEADHVRNGNFNFPGIGKPVDL